jgi:hypothetical protein
MSQRKPEPPGPTDELHAPSGTSAPVTPHGRLKPLDEQPAASSGTAPSSTRDNRPVQHAGYAEMDSRQRQRWNEASAALDPAAAVWGSNDESNHAGDEVADSDRRPSRPEGQRVEAAPAVKPKARKA